MRVIEGGCTCSLRASSPGVALPQVARVPSTDISVGLSRTRSTRWRLSPDGQPHHGGAQGVHGGGVVAMLEVLACSCEKRDSIRLAKYHRSTRPPAGDARH
ncbi:hypothetical protein SVIOM342S_10586 [Streptomyces violaceorubidus]